MKSNLDSAQNDFLLKEGPRQQQSVDIHARNCISFNSISAKGFTRPLPGHSGATLFKEILTEIIFCKLVSFPTTFEKESLCIPVLEDSILMQFWTRLRIILIMFISGSFPKMKWIQCWAARDYFLPGCLLCWQMRMSTTSRSRHQQEVQAEKWLSYYFRTLRLPGLKEWQRNISQRCNSPRHFSRKRILIRSWDILICGVCRSWRVACKYLRLISVATHPEPEPERRPQAQSFTVYFKHLPHLVRQ